MLKVNKDSRYDSIQLVNEFDTLDKIPYEDLTACNVIK
jgi:hypothetical protein